MAFNVDGTASGETCVRGACVTGREGVNMTFDTTGDEGGTAGVIRDWRLDSDLPIVAVFVGLEWVNPVRGKVVDALREVDVAEGEFVELVTESCW